MAVDKNKVTAEATKLVQKGQFDKAIKLYEKIIADDAKDVRVLLKIGELQQKKGDNAAAAETFSRVADAYGEQGFFLKAVAVYKQMMKLAPDDVRVNERLAGLYQQLGILSDAMAQLQIVAAAAEKAADQPKLLDVLRRMVDLDPDNVGSAVTLGELYARQSQPKLALVQLRRAAENLRRNNRADEYVKVAERIAFLAPDDLALTRELANIYLAKGDTKRALAKLQLCFKADPKDLETLTLLAQAFKDLGQLSKTLSVYKELAHLYADKGRADEARATWRRVLELAPDDPEAAQAVGPARPPAPPPRAPVAAPPPGARPAPAAAPAAQARAAPAPPGGAARPPGPEAIPKLLTETDVYVKYGLHEKALEHLKKVFAIDPEHLDAREKALQLRATRNDAAGAAEEAAAVARIALARGLDDRAGAAIARLRELAPAHPQLAALAAQANAAAGAPTPVDADEDVVLEIETPAVVEEDELALAAAGAPTEEIVEDEPVPLDRRAPAGAARAELRPPPVPRPPVAAAPAAARPVPAPVLVVAPPPAPAPRASPARAAPAGKPPPPPPPAATADPDDEEDLDDEIEEADFLIQQGLFDDARDALENLLAFYPGHAKLEAKRADLRRRAAPPPVPAPAAPVAPADESFDIARELADELGSAPAAPALDEEFQYSVEDVFDQFKKGVAQTVKAEDSDTHYDLGIAYKEMGLLDDALHEFEVALAGKGRKKEVDCLGMIALCKTEKGDPAGAVQAYQRALRSHHLTADSARAVHYELAGAYEATGDAQSALHFLHKVLKGDPAYRDAKKKLARLGGGPGRPPPVEEPARPTADARPQGVRAAPAVPAEPKAAPRSAPGAGPKKNIGYL